MLVMSLLHQTTGSLFLICFVVKFFRRYMHKTESYWCGFHGIRHQGVGNSGINYRGYSLGLYREV